MKTWRRYKNHSSGAKIAAWAIDLAFGPPFRALRALRRLFSAAKETPEAPGKILLVRLDHIGDLLMTTPAIRALKRRFPQSSLSLLASPSSLPAVAGIPEIERSHSFRVPWYDGGRAQRFPALGYIRLIRRLRREHYDAAIDFRGDIRVMFLFLLLSGARQRIGFSDLGGEFLLTRARPYDAGRHFAELNLALAGSLAGRPLPEAGRPFMGGAAGDASRVDTLLAGLGIAPDERLVAIQPSTIPHWRLKRWPPERFAALADALVRRQGARILLVGGPDDRQALQEVAAAMEENALIAAGKTTLTELGELLKRCRLFVANDTGPMHVAAAAGAPLVAIFGPTDPGRSGPLGDPDHTRVVRRDVPCRRPCFVAACPRGHECMAGITLEDVLPACLELLRGRFAAAAGCR